MKSVKHANAKTDTAATTTVLVPQQSSTTPTPTPWSVWQKQLITKEDPFHVHKILGILCLVSYVWRFCMALLDGNKNDMGFQSVPQWTLPTVGLHLALNLSSFVFVIPRRRITSGYRIWPEYRFHSLVFLCRSLTFITFQYFADHQHYHHQQQQQHHHSHHQDAPHDDDYFQNLMIILGSMVAADVGSRMFPESSSSGFVRNLEIHPAVRFFFSFLQILATSGCLCLSNHRYSMHFIFCFIIQVNAFLMTLRRKNLAGHYTLISIYGTMLLGGWIIGDGETARLGINARYQMYIVGLTAAFLRLFPRNVLALPLSAVVHSKYFIWPFCYVLVQYFFPPLVESATESVELFYGAVACHVAVGLLAVYKITSNTTSSTTRLVDASKKS